MADVMQVDARLASVCARRAQTQRGDFWRLIDALLDSRNYLTTTPDTGTDVPTREALDGSPRSTTGPERAPA